MDENELQELYETRRQRLKKLLQDKGYSEHGGQTKFADKVDRAPNYISNLINGNKNLGESLARHIEAVMVLPQHWLDKDDAHPSSNTRGSEVREPRETYHWPFKRFTRAQITGLQTEDREAVEKAVVEILDTIRRHSDPEPARKKTS